MNITSNGYSLCYLCVIGRMGKVKENIIRQWENQGMGILDYQLLNKLRAVIQMSNLGQLEKLRLKDILNDLEMIAEGED